MDKLGAIAVTITLFAVALSATGGGARAWGNGGYSYDYDITGPRYGTHDWIAQHALDYLPEHEKAWLVMAAGGDNLDWYLLGTELPDRPKPDGYGDATATHHFYFYPDGTVQEDDAGKRAQSEYDLAVAYARAGNLTAAAIRIGAMTHYVSDLASFGHVMGAATHWGAEDPDDHQAYETWIGTKTTTYEGFASYLRYDGSLSNITAYDAARDMAYDTTFDASSAREGGQAHNCTWLAANYSNSTEAAISRSGELIGHAVNLVADLLHSFYLQALTDGTAADTTAPVITSLTPDARSSVTAGDVTISADYRDDQGIDAASIVLILDGRRIGINVSGGAVADSHSISFNTFLGNGTHSIQLYVEDLSGNHATASWNFSAVAPGASQDPPPPASDGLAAYPPLIIGLIAVAVAVAAVAASMATKKGRKKG